jgi:hypothetical protein
MIPQRIADVEIPDTRLVAEATELDQEMGAIGVGLIDPIDRCARNNR